MVAARLGHALLWAAATLGLALSTPLAVLGWYEPLLLSKLAQAHHGRRAFGD